MLIVLNDILFVLFCFLRTNSSGGGSKYIILRSSKNRKRHVNASLEMTSHDYINSIYRY